MKKSLLSMAIALLLVLVSLSGCESIKETLTPSDTATTPTYESAEITNEPPQHIHTFGEWAITKAATCQESGIQERSCTCGENSL